MGLKLGAPPKGQDQFLQAALTEYTQILSKRMVERLEVKPMPSWLE